MTDISFRYPDPNPKKIRGWKLKEDYFSNSELKKAVIVAYGDRDGYDFMDHRNRFKTIFGEHCFVDGSIVADRLRAAGLLTKMFTPVYEEQKKGNMNTRKKLVRYKLKEIDFTNKELENAIICVHSACPRSFLEAGIGCPELMRNIALRKFIDDIIPNSIAADKLKQAGLLKKMFVEVYEDATVFGYKSPIKIANVPEGHIYVRKSGDPHTYIPHGLDVPSIPKEIVEMWEPEFDAPYKDILVGPDKYKVRISKGKIVVEGTNEIAYDDIYKIYSPFTKMPVFTTTAKNGETIYDLLIGSTKPYSVSFEMKVKIGCSYFTKEDIELVMNEYKSLNFTS